MGRINLQSLIDEVLSMAKSSQDLRKKKVSEDAAAQVNQPWDSTPEGQSYWKDMRMKNAMAEKQGLISQRNIQQDQDTPGRVARQSLGTKSQGDNGKGLPDFLTKIAEQDSDLFTNQARKPELENLKKTLSEMGFNQQQSGLNSADAPTQEEIQNLYFSGQSDKDFRKSVDNNLGLKGMGYVLNEKTGKMTRVVNNEVYGPGEQANAQSNTFNGNARNSLNMISNTPDNMQSVVNGINKGTPIKNETPSFLDIDRQITEEERKKMKKFTGNKYLDWGLRRAYNIAHAPVRMMGGLEYLADKNLRKVGDWEGWDK